MENNHREKELLILPFDRRATFIKLLGIKGRPLNREEKKQISDYKRIIYEGFKLAIENGFPKQVAGVLVDEEFGADIAHEAKDDGYILASEACGEIGSRRG